MRNVTREARLDRLLQRRVALASDLVHDRGGHAGALELREGRSGIDGAELLLVASYLRRADCLSHMWHIIPSSTP